MSVCMWVCIACIYIYIYMYMCVRSVIQPETLLCLAGGWSEGLGLGPRAVEFSRPARALFGAQGLGCARESKCPHFWGLCLGFLKEAVAGGRALQTKAIQRIPFLGAHVLLWKRSFGGWTNK